MPQIDWLPPHSDALREFLAKGMSFADAAHAINAKFDTSYSRNAAIGRGKRMGLASSHKPAELRGSPQKESAPRLREQSKHSERSESGSTRPVTPFRRAAGVNLRCIEIVPRHLTLIELEAGDCRYPFGGDAEGEAITFCGHPQRDGSSYCAGHFHLTCGPGTASERAAVAICLWLVEAA
jgi:GcrA cell cycle regulator